MLQDKKGEPTKVGDQKIECSVVECTHNCLEDSTCRLNKIRVCPNGNLEEIEEDNSSLCGSYHYIGDENVTGITGRG